MKTDKEWLDEWLTKDLMGIRATDEQRILSAMRDYKNQEVAKVISSNPPVIKSVCDCGAEHSGEAQYDNSCNYCLKQIK